MNYIRLPNGMSSTFYQPCISAEISFAKAARAAALLPLTADFTVVVFSQILQFLSVSTASRIFLGMQVQSLLKKALTLDIQMICPLHGPVWRSNLVYIINKYDIWSKYEAEGNSVMIAYASIYGNTENAAYYLANELSKLGVKDIAMYDVSSTDVSYLISETFRCSHIVLMSATYNLEIYPKMDDYISDIYKCRFFIIYNVRIV